MKKRGIGWAVKQLKKGESVTRKGWNGENMYLGLIVPDMGSDVSEPYVFMKTAQNTTIPWLCSQADLLATDWKLA